MTSAASPETAGQQHAAKRAARLLATQMIYQAEKGGEGAEAAALKTLGKHPGVQLDPNDTNPVAADQQLATDIVTASIQSREQVDQLLSGALDAAWPLHRLDAVMRALLRAGVAELLHNTKVDHPIIISDYVDVAHAFFSGKEPGMVNGVLDKITKQIRAV